MHTLYLREQQLHVKLELMLNRTAMLVCPAHPASRYIQSVYTHQQVQTRLYPLSMLRTGSTHLVFICLVGIGRVDKA